MLRAIIVEDEPLSRKLFETMLNTFGNVDVVASADSVSSGFDAILSFKPDLVFLDIEMNNETAFDLLEKFPKITFDIIFTTAHEHYALKAIKFSAIDYLLKPIDLNDLHSAIEKVENRKFKDNITKNLEVLMHNIKSQQHEQQIALATSEGLIFVNVADIVLCISDGPYTTFHLKKGDNIMTSRNLKEYEELLSEHRFFRIHKSYLVNLNEIKRYIRGEGGQVVMSNGITVDVSKRRKESFLSTLSKV